MALLAALLGLAVPIAAPASLRIDVPDVRGDQLIFFYDARDDRVQFMSVSNPAPSDSVLVEVAFYSADLASVVASTEIEVPAGGTKIIDPTIDALSAVNGHFGLAVLTPIDDTSKAAVVPPVPLTGTFTLANLELNAAFGENAMGRLAVLGDGTRATPGERVDDKPIRYQQFAPVILTIPTYFDPSALAPPENDGNRVIVAAFEDTYGDRFRIAAHANVVRVGLCDGSGAAVAMTELSVDGVALTNLQGLAGGVALTSAGSAYLSPEPLGSSNLFGIFSQSAGTFAAGQRMPALDMLPACQAAPTPAPTAMPTPSPTCGNNKLEDGEQCDGRDFGTALGAAEQPEDLCSLIIGDGGAFDDSEACTGNVSCGLNCVRTVACCCPCKENRNCNDGMCESTGYCGPPSAPCAPTPTPR